MNAELARGKYLCCIAVSPVPVRGVYGAFVLLPGWPCLSF
jgi:hypothetical protein